MIQRPQRGSPSPGTQLHEYDPVVWLTGAHARADGPAGGAEWLQLRDLFVRMGHPAPEQILRSMRLFAEEVMPAFSGNATSPT